MPRTRLRDSAKKLMNESHRTDSVEDTYTPDQDRSLNRAVIQAVETHLDSESGHSDCTTTTQESAVNVVKGVVGRVVVVSGD